MFSILIKSYNIENVLNIENRSVDQKKTTQKLNPVYVIYQYLNKVQVNEIDKKYWNAYLKSINGQ